VSAAPAGPEKAGGGSRLGRRLHKAWDIVYYALLRSTAALIGFKPRHRAADRRQLDREILPKLAANSRYARVLFVGCDWYTEHVEELFTARGRAYATLEVDPARARHGARHHFAGSLVELDRFFAADSLDLIICNGVIGWGLDDPDEIERAIEACSRALSPGGLLLLGWDEVPEKLPVPIERIRALAAFRAATPEGLDGPLIRTPTYANHTFGFFVKPDPAAG